MKRKGFRAGLLLVLLAAGVGGALAWRRLHQAREFSRRWEVQTESGTNYAVRLVEATVGRLENGCLLIVSAEFLNPNPFLLELPRNRFVLETGDRRQYLPSASGTQSELIKLGPGGVSGRELFTFTIPEDSLRGVLRLQVGRNWWLSVKDASPYELRLRSGQFRSFHRREW